MSDFQAGFLSQAFYHAPTRPASRPMAARRHGKSSGLLRSGAENRFPEARRAARHHPIGETARAARRAPPPPRGGRPPRGPPRAHVFGLGEKAVIFLRALQEPPADPGRQPAV